MQINFTKIVVSVVVQCIVIYFVARLGISHFLLFRC